MIISPKDPWEAQFIRNLKDADLLAWEDEDARLRYPKWSHIYDKLWLGKNHSDIKTWNLEKEIPNKYPVYVKPRTNTFGLGKDSYIAFCEEEIEDIQGMIAQDFVEGTHYSTDYVLDEGKIIDSWTFIGHKSFYNDFLLWESVPFPDSIHKKVKTLLSDYTGIANFESIDGKIIEGHLRGSLQFYDICGGLLQQMPNYLKTGKYTPTRYYPSYSKVLRTRHDGYVRVQNLPSKSPKVTSLQLTYVEDKKLSETDPGAVRRRFAVINGTDLQVIENYAKMLRGRITIK